MLPNHVPVHSRAQDFTAALAQNAGLAALIPLEESIAAGRVARCRIVGIRVVSSQQLDWEFWFFSNQKFQDAPGNADPTTDGFLGFWSFSVAGGDGKRIGAAGNYYYYIDGLGIDYEVTDGNPTLNVLLVNRSAGGKTLNAPFAVVFVIEPTGAQ